MQLLGIVLDFSASPRTCLPQDTFAITGKVMGMDNLEVSSHS
jgi:hypothetical protein